MGVGGSVIGIGALIDPESAVNFVAGADDLATSWAGRNLGLGIAMLVAVSMRHAAGYAAAFAGAICRELSDVIVEFNVAFFVIMLIEIVCLLWLRMTLGASPRLRFTNFEKFDASLKPSSAPMRASGRSVWVNRRRTSSVTRSSRTSRAVRPDTCWQARSRVLVL